MSAHQDPAPPGQRPGVPPRAAGTDRVAGTDRDAGTDGTDRDDRDDRVPAIEVRALTKRYGSLTAVDRLDLEVAPGETLALLGPNGAGKTTTVECCEGYRSPDGGTVRVLGLDPHRDARQLRPRVGLMLQEGGVYPMARPHEVLRLFSSFYADPLDAEDLLEQVGLTHTRRTRFRDLSGGEKQRLSLALALVGRPEILFLDEPTAGLDPAARRRTWDHVRALRATGVTVVLTTHLLDEAEQLADRVAIIDHGRLVALGTPDELTHGTSASVEFSAQPGLALDSLGAALGAEVIVLRAGRYQIKAANSPELIVRLSRWLADHKVVLGELQAGKSSLEDVFLRLTDPTVREQGLSGPAGPTNPSDPSGPRSPSGPSGPAGSAQGASS